MSGSWAGSMQAALAASLGRPAWWVMALAAFLVRGGILLVLLPLIALPSASALATAFAPTVEAVAMSRQSLAAVLLVTGLVGLAVIVLLVVAVAGSWLDNALQREAELADELDLHSSGPAPSAWRSLSIRLLAHAPTLVALAYAVFRIVIAVYQELLSPGNPDTPLELRVLGRAPDAVLLLAIVWLVAEAIGGIAARRAAEGEGGASALRGAIRDLLGVRGAATFLVTNALVIGAAVLLLVVVGRAADHVRTYLLGGVDAVSLAAALLLLVTTWLLSLAVLSAALAWRATAWTIESAPRRPAAAAIPAAEEAATSEAPAG